MTTMVDYTMCDAHGCAVSNRCRRHRNSGTEAGPLQSFADWSAEPDWTPDHCRGAWPLVVGRPAKRNSGALYRGGW
jgi:hypothetical protein